MSNMHRKAHGSNAYNYFVVFVAALGSFTFGFTNAIVGTVLGRSCYRAMANTVPMQTLAADRVAVFSPLFWSVLGFE